MKKTGYAAGAALASGLLFLLAGCNHRVTDIPAQVQELKPMQQSYRGVLPCADCEGIETTLFLDKNGDWVINRHYQKGIASADAVSYGTWARPADKLVLTDSKQNKLYFRPDNNGLEALDVHGNPTSPVYRLTAIQQIRPQATSVVMKGMYKYMADVAIITDCATRRTFLVTDSPQLELGYSASRDASMAPLLVSVKAHFTLEENSDTGVMRLAIVADENGQFIPGKDCDN